MGPQLDSCGRRAMRHEQACYHVASMGPQLDSCGRLILDVDLSDTTPGFNGAAT